jgi:hypothetical protein
MSHDKEHKHYSPRALDRLLRQSAESWWHFAFLFRISIFFVGTFAIFTPLLSTFAPFLVAFLTMIAGACALRYGVLRDTWEDLHRELDTRDSFGWQISNAKLSDLLTQTPKKLRKQLPAETNEEEYFASKKTSGPERAVENMQESAWWAKHLSRRAGNIYTAIVIALIFGSFAVLILSIETIKDYDALSNVARVITSTIMVLFSLDLLRTSLAYYKYSGQAAMVEELAGRLLSEDTANEIKAIKLMQQYHLAHAAAPMNPNWLWKLMRDDLNELWDTYRRQK